MTDYKLHLRAHVDRPDNRGSREPQPPAVAFHLQIGKRANYETIRLTVEEAYDMAGSLLDAANMLRRHP